ncbi:MAG: YlxR family protein [Deltaproteobacteria bacterium]|nr:YlxR family protein [Deltaproteobacteria bacterium]
MKENASNPGGPVRTCLGCLKKRNKFELVRLAVDREGNAVWDAGQRRTGRGAYICPSRDCLNAAVKKKKFARAFRRPVSTALLAASEAPWENE